MNAVNPYLTFSGNCREAMAFYRSCFGGELAIQSIGESPLAGKMPAKMKDSVLHATLTKGSLLLMGSDMVPASGLVTGNALSIAVSCGSGEELTELFRKLSDGGSVDHLPENTFWGGVFGDLKDRYGHHWLLSYTAKN